MVTFSELRDANFDALRQQGDDWGQTRQQLLTLRDAFKEHVNSVTENAGWKGHASDLADVELEKVVGRLELAAVEAQAIQTALTHAPDELQTIQNQFRQVLDDMARAGFTVEDNGGGGPRVNDTPGFQAPTDPEAEQSREQAFADGVQRITELLRQAYDTDSRYAGVLAACTPSHVNSLDAAAWQNARGDLEHAAALTGAGPIPANMDPQQAAAWWNSLTDQQRAEYVQTYSHEIGDMDGLPATARDQANRLALESRREEVALEYAETPGDSNSNQWIDLNNEYYNLSKIQTVLDKGQANDPAQALMLLKFGNQFRDGQVVISVGNPDTAKNVAVYVPGTNNTVDDLDGGIKRTTNLQVAASPDKDTRSQVATIFWLDYDAPEYRVPDDAASAVNPGDYAFSSMVGWGRSEEGAPRLQTFVQGLRVQQPGAHITAVGHSYGTCVIGDAARLGPGLQVNDIVLSGSPGVHVDRASELGIDPHHVWVERADGDPIPEIGEGSHGGDSQSEAVTNEIMGLVFGSGIGPTLPSDPSFGANRMIAQDGGHSSYFDVDANHQPLESLQNQGKVIMGTYNDPDPGKRPQLVFSAH